MPIHDWTRVDAGIFHGFHQRWMSRLAETLTATLPPDYYAETEQHADERIADVLTLHASPTRGPRPIPLSGPGTAVLDTPPKLAGHRSAKRIPKERQKPKHVAIRHTSGHRIVALLELVSPANKDRRLSVVRFAEKVQAAVLGGVHVVVIDLFPPTRSAPHGLPSRAWQRFDRSPVVPPPGRLLSLGSFVAKPKPEGFFEVAAVGDELPPFPLYLTDTHYIHLPLADTYAATFAASAPYLRDLLAAPASPGA